MHIICRRLSYGGAAHGYDLIRSNMECYQNCSLVVVLCSFL